MNRHLIASSLPAALLLVGLLACQGVGDPDGHPPDGPGNGPPTSETRQARQVSGDASTRARAEALAYEQLDARHATLLAGVEAVWTDRVALDTLGMAHVRLVQTVDNIPVFGGEAIVHVDPKGQTGQKGAFAGMTDGLVRNIDLGTRGTEPALTDLQAIDLAVASTGGWQRVSAPPRAQLYIVRRPAADHLAYRVDLHTMQPGDPPAQPVVFIDAHTGAEIWRYDNLRHFALQNTSQTVHDMHNQTKFTAATIGDSSDGDLYATYKSVSATLKFFAVEHSRDSYDNAGAVVDTYGHYGASYVNAYWDTSAQRLVVGDGDGGNFGYFGVSDIIAHEFAHGVMDNEAGLTPSGESGALDEGNSDITAAAVADFRNHDWVFNIGEDCWLPTDPSKALRYMSRPSHDGVSRDHYSNRYTGSADSGGIHWNSGIANHFFYLLVEGGRHHNPVYRSGVTVSGIGMDAAYHIWYRAISVYMVASSNFAAARLATEKACGDLYSASTCDQVSKAWYEVGVGAAP